MQRKIENVIYVLNEKNAGKRRIHGDPPSQKYALWVAGEKSHLKFIKLFLV